MGETDQLSAYDAELLREITRAVKSLQFGSVQVVVHEGRVVEVATTEKRRIPLDK